MRRDDRDDPFDEFFRELERMMNEAMGPNGDVHVDRGGSGAAAGAGTDLHVDVHESDEEIRVVADVPGVEKDAIDLRCDGEVLTIDASGERGDVRERVTLPTRVDEHSASATFNNGVLEVSFDRRDDASDISLS